MHFKLIVRRATRALGMRATSAAGSPPVMVPLSVLEAAREDARAHAAREAQLNDARIDEAKARIDEVKAHAAHEAERNDARIVLLERINALNLSTALFERDLA